MSRDLAILLQRTVSSGSLDQIIDDLQNQDGVWIDSALNWWDVNNYKDIDFSWNFAACFAIFASKSTGCNLSPGVKDYVGGLSALAKESITQFLTNAGSVEAGKPTPERQAIRKSTALLHFLAVKESTKKINTDQLGLFYHDIIKTNPQTHVSLLSSAAHIVSLKGKEPLVSRTEDKEQSAFSREYSPMNAVGVISCRATERIIRSVLENMKTDRMCDPHAEATLYTNMTGVIGKRNLFISADNSRFGPNQIMSKSRVLVASLLLPTSDQKQDRLGTVFTYILTTESTRLMENKFSKMPHELFQSILSYGGPESMLSVDKNSTLGQLAAEILKNKQSCYNGNLMLPGFTQHWGMYQGALGMLSSAASSLLHDFFKDVVQPLTSGPKPLAMVTNDDSLIILQNLTDDYSMRQLSKAVKNILREVLALGGQKLNLFKTVCSSAIAEFHSTFCLQSGLIVPELKNMFPEVMIPHGNRMNLDAEMCIEKGVNILRKGCSLFSATCVSLCNSILHCESYGRWKAVQKHGCRPAELGGPVYIDLLKELITPGWGSYHWYIQCTANSQNGKLAQVLAKSMISDEKDKLMEFDRAGLTMTTRQVHRAARGKRETQWWNPLLHFPLAQSTCMGHLVSSVTAGIFTKNLETSLDKATMRFGRNQVAYKNKNLVMSDNSWPLLIKTVESYEDLDSISKDDFTNVMDNIDVEFNDESAEGVITVLENFLSVARRSANLPTTKSLLIKHARQGELKQTVMPLTVIPYSNYKPPTGTIDAVRVWGTPKLKQMLKMELRQEFDLTLDNADIDHLKNIEAAALLVNRLVKNRQGVFMVQHTDAKVSHASNLVAKIASHTIKGLSTVVPGIKEFAMDMENQLNIMVEVPRGELSVDFYSFTRGLALKKIISHNAIITDVESVIDMIRNSESHWGWTHRGRTKLLGLRQRLKGKIRDVYKNAAIITNIYVDGMNKRSYKHYLLSADTKLNPRDFENWPQYIDPSFIYEVNKPIHPTDKDTVELLSINDVNTVVFKKYGSNVIAITPKVQWPFKRLIPEPKGEFVARSNDPWTIGDAIVAFSWGTIVPGDKRYKELTESTNINSMIEELMTLYKTSTIRVELMSGYIQDRDLGSDYAHDIWYRSASRLKPDMFDVQFTSEGEYHANLDDYAVGEYIEEEIAVQNDDITSDFFDNLLQEEVDQIEESQAVVIQDFDLEMWEAQGLASLNELLLEI
jgi:hypothetical protein